jgi:3-oxoacyl-[acyl-carrier-protein] synthase-1
MTSGYLSASGMVCPVGLGVSAACAAMRAGIAKFDELPYWDGKGLPVIGAAVPGLDPDLRFGPRLVELLTMSLRDCLSEMRSLPLRSIPLLVGLAEPDRPGGAPALPATVIREVESRLKVSFHPTFSAVVPRGHTSAFEALRMARDMFQSTAVPGCLVCGVDSYLNASSLYWLDQSWRLKREGHTDGVIPGEAAAAIYVSRQAPEKAEGAVGVTGLGFARETATVLSEEPLRALGMSEACRQALAEAGCSFHQIEFRISDATGENHGFRELALAEGRLARVVRKEPQPVWHAADSIGDTGAAAGFVQLVTAKAAWAKDYAPGDRALCFGSSVPGDRAAAVLEFNRA